MPLICGGGSRLVVVSDVAGEVGALLVGGGVPRVGECGYDREVGGVGGEERGGVGVLVGVGVCGVVFLLGCFLRMCLFVVRLWARVLARWCVLFVCCVCGFRHVCAWLGCAGWCWLVREWCSCSMLVRALLLVCAREWVRLFLVCGFVCLGVARACGCECSWLGERYWRVVGEGFPPLPPFFLFAACFWLVFWGCAAASGGWFVVFCVKGVVDCGCEVACEW